jgi:outer membrane protein OmpA-like peptidoglycan-associated protein
MPPPPPPQIPPVQAELATPPTKPAPAVAETNPPPPAAAPKPRPPAQLATTPPRHPETTAMLEDLQHRKPEISYEVSEIRFATGSAEIPDAAKADLDAVVKVKREDGGTVRVVGYAEPARRGDAVQREVEGLDMALTRARTVAAALTQRGVPADEIAIEAAPVRPGRSELPRAEVYLER